MPPLQESGPAWTCQRQSRGQRCGHKNPRRKRNCEMCGKPRPKRNTVRSQLTGTYEDFVLLNGGEHCGICGRGRPESGRKLHRDHDHKTGKPRGLLCFNCNLSLKARHTVEWLRAAIAYLERAA